MNIMTAMIMLDAVIDPFTQYAFMRRALAASVILSLSSAPLGVFVNVRQLSLVGDAMSHAILPGVAVAFSVFGFALLPMTLGGLATGIIIALMAVLLTRYATLRDDAALTLLYLVSMATGVTIISLNGNNLDLLHLLFGDILSIDPSALSLIAVTSCLTIIIMSVFYRRFVIESFDPGFAAAARRGHPWPNILFFALLVINLVAAFQALGTLMAVGLLILPGLAARYWSRNIDHIIPISIGVALATAPAGLLISYYVGKIPSGAAVILVGGCAALFSAFFGSCGSVRKSL